MNSLPQINGISKLANRTTGSSYDEKETKPKINAVAQSAAYSDFPSLVKQTKPLNHQHSVRLHRKPKPPEVQPSYPQTVRGRFPHHLFSPKSASSPTQTKIDAIKKKFFWLKSEEKPFHELAKIKIELIKKPTDFATLKKCVLLYNQLCNPPKVLQYIRIALRINPRDEELLELQKAYL